MVQTNTNPQIDPFQSIVPCFGTTQPKQGYQGEKTAAMTQNCHTDLTASHVASEHCSYIRLKTDQCANY